MSTQTQVVVASAVKQPTYAELQARIVELERVKANDGSKLKVTAKGGVSHYCLGRFPVTLTKKQWAKVIATVKSGELEAFLLANDSKLFQGHETAK